MSDGTLVILSVSLTPNPVNAGQGAAVSVRVIDVLPAPGPEERYSGEFFAGEV